MNRPVKKLHIGCGKNVLDGWINTDINPALPGVIALDAVLPWPQEFNRVDYIFSEHMIEHFDFVDAINILINCFKSLNPGGKIRITTPDIQHLIDIFSNRHGEEYNHIDTKLKPWFSSLYYPVDQPLGTVFNTDTLPVHYLNWYVRQDRHLFIHSKETLKSIMTLAGFIDLKEYSICDSYYPEFRNLEFIGRVIDNYGTIGKEMLQKESMTIEGIKP